MEESKKIESGINLKDINSRYIIEKVFHFLSEKQKLNMIIYNKKYQKMLLVDIADYKNTKKI